jgi:hypothetical protein
VKPTFYKVTYPNSGVVEILAGGELNLIGSGWATLARKICKLRRDQFPGNPEKWVCIQPVSNKKVQLLPSND